MANEFLITDVVSSKAIQDLNNLLDKFGNVKKEYSSLAQELAKGISIPVHNYDELTKKAKSFEEIQKKLSATEKELIQVQQEYKTLLKNVAEEVRKNTKEALEHAKANDLNAQAELKAAKAETERLKQQKLINQESKRRKYTIEEGISALKMEIKTMKDAEEQNKILRSAIKQIDLTTEEGRKTALRFNEAINRNTNFLKRNSDELVQNKMNVGRYKEDIRSAASEILKGNISIKNMGNLAKGTGGLLKTEMASGLQEVSSGVGNMIKGFIGAQAILSGIQKMISLFKTGVQSAIDFEAANSQLAAILGTTTNATKELTADARRLGETTKFTASQATALQVELAKLGFSKNEILESTEYVLKFAQATGAELPEAAALAGAALRMFNADTSETERYVSAMAVATTKSALSFSYLQTAMPIVGPVAKAFNFQIEDTLALLGKLADAGFDASMSATATRNILLNLADGSGKLAQALGGPVKTLPELVDGLNKLKEQGIDLNSTLELTDKRSVAAFNAFLTASDKIVPLREQITGVDKELDDMANTMGDNVQGALYNLSSAWEGFMITLNGSNGILRGFIEDMASLVRWMREVISTAEELGQERLDAAKRVGQEAAKSDKEWVQSKIESIDKVALYYRKEGVDGFEAYEKAREEQIKVLERALAQEEARLQLYLNRNKKSINAYNESWNSLNPLKIFNLKDLKGEIKESFELLENQTSYVESLRVKINQLQKIPNDYLNSSEPTFVAPKTDKELEKERQALEKVAKERLRIRETLQQSELDLMDEGLEKELAKISFNYNKRIAAIKGNSKEEQETIENLAKKMQQELENYEIDYYLNQEKKIITQNLSVIKKGSEEEYKLKLSLLNVQEEAEKEVAIRKNEDIESIEERYKNKRMELDRENIRNHVKFLEQENQLQLSQLDINNQQRLNELEKAHKEGWINEKEYQQGLYNIQRDSAKLRLELMIAEAQAELVAAQGILPEDEVKKIQLRIDSLRAQLEAVSLANPEDGKKVEQWSEGFIAALQNMQSVANETMEGWGDVFGVFTNLMTKMAAKADGTTTSITDMFSKMWNDMTPGERGGLILGAFASIANGVSKIMNNMYDSRIEKIEEEQEALQEAHDKEIERIENLESTGAISSEEAEARKRAAEDKTAHKEKELEQKKIQMQEKQAKWEKSNSIIQSIIATSLAVTKALPNFVLAAIVAAMGLAQTAIIASQPIPKYAKGTKDHPGGLAIVGDGGKKEGIITDGGLFVTPANPILVDLPKHSQVIPDLSFIYDRKGLGSDFLLLEQQKKNMADNGIIVNVDNDYSRLEKRMEGNTKQLQSINKLMKKANRNAEFNWISKRV